MIVKGFDECMRVLKPQGTLIFKWNEHEIKSKQVLDLIPYKPLFGHTSGKQAKTIWMAFMKNNPVVKHLLKETVKELNTDTE
jgi:hypothetical protein